MMFGKIKYISDNTAVVEINKDGNLVSNLLAFSRFHEMDELGKLICSALCISGAFVFGGQLAFVNSMTPHISTAFIVSKFVGGFLSLILALLYWQFIKNRQMES